MVATMPQKAPNRDFARWVADRLHEALLEAQKELGNRDPELQSLYLGMTMFFGMHMAAVPFEYRQQMCDAAIGYSLQASRQLNECG
jgi:hypothetical protein